MLVHDLDTELSRARLQDLEQCLALEPAEAVTGRPQDLALDVNLDVVPAREPRGDLRVGLRIGRCEIAERRVAEHDAEAERLGRTVALVHHDLVLGRCALDEDAEVEPGGSTADARELHAGTLPSVEVHTGRRRTPCGRPGLTPERTCHGCAAKTTVRMGRGHGHACCSEREA